MLAVHGLLSRRSTDNPQISKMSRIIFRLLVRKADNSRNLLIKTTAEPVQPQYSPVQPQRYSQYSPVQPRYSQYSPVKPQRYSQYSAVHIITHEHRSPVLIITPCVDNYTPAVHSPVHTYNYHLQIQLVTGRHNY